ncbi:MAG TPA: sialate O-acetylesterase [Planctomycetes bacterium]|nr:sialate O-acetylesterase [Planctomycetota bacterium]HIL37046.1 sialate O-acetylesterase [Planctomycetota bacterium]
MGPRGQTRRLMLTLGAWLAPLLSFAPSASAQLTLASYLTDHMVIQREQPISLWGSALPHAQVTVQCGKERRLTSASNNGFWQVALSSRPATCQSFAITIESGGKKISIDDLLVGDVWICAGQSNMEFPLSRDQDGPEALTGSAPMGIRVFQARYPTQNAGLKWSPRTVSSLAADSFMQGKWTRCSPEALGSLSAVGYYFGHALWEQLEIPIGLVDLAAGGTPTEAWISPDALASQPQTSELIQRRDWLKNPLLGEWCRQRAALNLENALAAGLDIPGDQLGCNHPFKPGFMWRAALHPIRNSAVRGILWYQGESNAESPSRVDQHASLFPLLVQDTRNTFGQAHLPFLFVQLPAMGRPHWPEFREQQRGFSQQIPHVGMAVTIDVGHPTDVHPRRKRPVGIRLARLAMHVSYGQSQAPTGPIIKRASMQSGGIELEFENIQSKLSTSDQKPPRGFEIIACDGAVYAAEAQLMEGAVLLIGAPTQDPCEVRYAWKPVPDCNLTDSQGLPASPFRIPIER